MPKRTVIIRTAIAAGLAIAIAVTAASCSDDTDAGSVPVLVDPNITGKELATEFLTILQGGDLDELDAFLADGFQLQRADGTGATKSEYLQAPAVIHEFTIGPVVTAAQDDDVLTVRWTVAVEAEIAGQPLRTGEAPRLSTFVYDSGRWRIVAHANFNLPAA